MGSLGSVIAATLRYHVIHFGLLFGLPLVVLAIAMILDRRRHPAEGSADRARADRMRAAFGGSITSAPPAPRSPVEPKRARLVVALAWLSALAGFVHAGVIERHFREYWLFGVFFVFAAGAQIAWAGLITRNASEWLLTLGAVGNAAIVVLWSITRTVGLPFGPDPGAAESVGPLDGVATGIEVVIVVLCIVAMRARARPPLSGSR